MYLYLIATAGFWVAVVFIDGIFRSCMLPPYLKLLQNGNVKIKPGYIQFYTTGWNRLLTKWGHSRQKFQKIWFGLGTAFSVFFFMPLSIIALLSMVKNAILQREDVEQMIQPVLPGVNLPFSEIGFYLVTLLFCGIIHELGHALASTREDIKINGIGLFFLGIFPGAYVSLPTDQVLHLQMWQKLQIFCAGVWHNIALACIAYLLIVLNPYLSIPFYQSGNGVTCIDVVQNSGISGPTGLKLNDQITGINDCKVKTVADWLKCINETQYKPQSGFCISPEFVSEQGVISSLPSAKNCCTNLESSHLCFNVIQKFVCLPVRQMLQTSPADCINPEDCEFCARPILDSGHHRLLRISRRNENAVLFIGSPLELTTAVTISSYFPRFYFPSLDLVTAWEKLLNYIVAFSGALAVSNIIPCWGLDGQWIIETLVNVTLKHQISQRARSKMTHALTTGGTVLLVTAILFGMKSLLMRHIV